MDIIYEDVEEITLQFWVYYYSHHIMHTDFLLLFLALMELFPVKNNKFNHY